MPRQQKIYKNGTRFKNESVFKSWASKVFRDNGWVVYTTPDNTLRGGAGRKGFPDLIAYLDYESDQTLVALELKMPGNYPNSEQKGWVRALGFHFPVWVLWPRDESKVIAIAKREAVL